MLSDRRIKEAEYNIRQYLADGLLKKLKNETAKQMYSENSDLSLETAQKLLSFTRSSGIAPSFLFESISKKRFFSVSDELFKLKNFFFLQSLTVRASIQSLEGVRLFNRVPS